jgi:hypothetical protein
MATTIWLGKGASQVQVDRSVARTIEHVLDVAHKKIADRLARAADRIGVPAEARWPVGRERNRPHSADMFERGLRMPKAGVLEGFVQNTAKYAKYIRTMKGGLNGRSAMVELLRKPLKIEAKKVADDLAPELAAQIERLLGGGRG